MIKVTIGEQLAEILDEYAEEVREDVKKAISDIAKETVQKLRNTSPRRTGSYAKGWRSKSDGDVAIVYNATDGSLTHLLENGHDIQNKKGKYGRVAGIKHIEPVEQWANDELVRRVERKLNK